MHASAAFLFPCPVAVLCGCSGHGGNPVKRGQDADYKKNLFQRTPSITLAEGKSCRRRPESKDFPRLHIFRMKQRTETRAPLFSLISHTLEQTRGHEL
jgi:hypothetical protein